jgi:hypothetical protein
VRATNRRTRILGASVALLLHVAVVLVLANFVVAERPAAIPVFTMLVIPQREAPLAELPPRIVSPEQEQIGSLVTLPQLPPTAPITMPPVLDLPPSSAAAHPDLSGIGRVAFGCTPDHLGLLTTDERARCVSAGLGMAPDEASIAALAKFDAAQNAPFEVALQWKQQPLLLPCANPAAIALTLYTVYCLADGFINGFEAADSGKYLIYEPWPDEWQ